MEVRQQRERGCRVFLSCENQIFLKPPQQWLAEKAATAMTGQGHFCTHNLIHHRAPDTVSINLSSACPLKKVYMCTYIYVCVYVYIKVKVTSLQWHYFQLNYYYSRIMTTCLTETAVTALFNFYCTTLTHRPLQRPTPPPFLSFVPGIQSLLPPFCIPQAVAPVAYDL